MNEEYLFGVPVKATLAEYHRKETAVASRLDPDGERVEIGDDWIDLLPIPCDDGSAEVHVLGSSDPDLDVLDVYRHWFGNHATEEQMQPVIITDREKPDPMGEIWKKIEWLSQEVGALKQASKPAMVQPVQSPYLDTEEGAAYLRINVNSLYGLVERGRLVPLRGPRRRYRFTKAMLDAYLAGERKP